MPPAPFSQMQHTQFRIGKLSAADSIISLLGGLNVSAFPWSERIAVGACQAKANRAWLEASQSEGLGLRSRRSHEAVLRAVAEARHLATS